VIAAPSQKASPGRRAGLAATKRDDLRLAAARCRRHVRANWSLTDLRETRCRQCTGPASLVLVIDSKEYDGGTQKRWRPTNDPQPAAAQQPTGLLVGRWGASRIFACLTCPDTPFMLDQQ
jgi:hypothetical protein